MSSITSEITDETVRAAASGSRLAVEATVVWIMPLVKSHLRKKLPAVLSQESEVEDLAQEALAALARALNRLRNQTVPGLWSFTAKIAERKAYKRIAREKLLKNKNIDSGSLTIQRFSYAKAVPLTTFLCQSLFAKSPSPTTVADQQELIQKTLRALENLEPLDREVIRLAIYEKKILREICEEMAELPGAPQTAEAARKRLTRALKKLQTLLVKKKHA